MQRFIVLYLLTFCSIINLKGSPIDYSFLPYSGKVSVDGINFNGTVKFIFSIIEKNGVVHWKSSSSNTPIQIEVSNGRYLALLGGQGMPTLPTDLFLLEAELYLKVMADLGDGKGSRHIAPDQRITSTPHALSAEVAKRLLPGSVDLETLDSDLKRILESTLDEHLSPKILTQPSNLMPREGDNIEYSIDAEGYKLDYQWFKNGEPITNQNDKILNILNYEPQKNDGVYSLKASNEFGSVETKKFMIGISITTEWEKTFNNTITDVIPTADKGWLVGGNAKSNNTSDLFVSKINSQGQTIWSKILSAQGNDNLESISSASDGGFLLFATSNSSISGDKSENGRGANDYWLIKIDDDGNKLWDKTFGGNLDDEAIFITNSHHTGYLLGGRSYSSKSHEKSENNIFGSTGEGYDYWVIRIDETGNILWDRTLGSSGDDWINSVALSSDGGFVITGDSNGPADGNKSQEHIGGLWDFWIIKIDQDGNSVWDITLGGEADDEWPVINAVEDGFVAIGTSDSDISGDVTSGKIGGRDLWIIKVDENGEKIWDRKFGKNGTSDDWHYPRVVSSGKSLFITSFLDDRDGDTWLVKTDGDGRLVTEKRLSYDFHAPKFVLSEDRKEAVIFGGNAFETNSQSLLVKLIVDQEFLDDQHELPDTGSSNDYMEDHSHNFEVKDGSITMAKLSQKVLEELTKKITSDMLSVEILAELDRTIGKSNLTDQVLKYLKPEIVSQPNSQVVMTGEFIRLSPEIHGKYLSYQWEKNGQPIDGATSLNFEITDFNSTLHDGNYSLLASNEFGSVKTLSINLSSFVSLDKTFGGSENEELVDVLETKDNGFLLIGNSDSNGTGDQSEAKSRIGKDFWIVRTNTLGEKLWDKRLGGDGNDICKSGIVLEDGYLLAGYTTSKGTGDHSDGNAPAGINFWLLKIDHQGNKQWDKTYGGDGHDRCTTLLASEDGGFLLAGYSDSNQSGPKDSQGYGEYDYWVVKVDSSGNKLWDKTFGGTARDICQKAITDPAGGYLLWGESNSTESGNKLSGNNGLKDGWAVRIDRMGNLLWEKTYGGSISDLGKDLLKDPLGGYVLIGESNSSGYGQADFWVIRTDTQGNTLWSKNYGGTAMDHGQGVQIDKDGNYILSGISWSDQTGMKTVTNRGLSDFWVVKIDSSGGVIWDQTYGGIGEEISGSSKILANGQLLHFGSTTSGKSADKTQSSRGMLDYWMILSDHQGLITHDLSTTHEHGGISLSHALTQEQIELLETVPYNWSEELIPNGNMLGTASGFHDIYGWAKTPFTITTNQETGSHELLLDNKDTKATNYHRIYYSPSNRLAVNDLLFSQVTYLNNTNPKNTVVGVSTWGGYRIPVLSGVIDTTEGFEDHNDSYKSEFNLFKRETLNTSRPNRLAIDIQGNQVPNGLRIAYWSTRKIYSGDSDGDGYSDTDEIFFENTDPHSTPQGQAWNIDLNTTVSLEMLWVEPGTFTMGKTGVDEPEHNVTLTNGFYLGKHEITQAQYEAVMTGNSEGRNANPSEFGGNPNRPVENVSWHDAMAFCQILSQKEKDAGRLPADWNYTLPTEAQWEYACRAGTTTSYSWGDDINSSHANYNNTIGETSNIGSYAANPWGFFDMHGNVWEWNLDDKRVYSSNNMVDPFGSVTNTHSSERGGDFSRNASYVKSAFRNNNRKTNTGSTVGFRLALVRVP